ncbi:hypothetical protein BGX31_004176, partial [Mortierella sp. GBA43]
MAQPQTHQGPEDDENVDQVDDGIQLIEEESSYDVPSEECITAMELNLNSDQRRAYQEIKAAYLEGRPQAFFIDGPAGTGKTFLYNLLLSM